MILSIDHIACSSSQLEEDIESIESLGYQQRFVSKEIINLSIKRNLMHQFHENHDLALFSREGSVGIELLDHGVNARGHAHYTPIFEDIPPEWIVKTGAKLTLDIELTEAQVNFIGMDSYITTTGSPSSFRFNKVIVKTADLRKSVDFWSCFGFKMEKEDKDFVLLKFSTILNSQIFQIYIQKELGSEKISYLDDGGFNCIAFISHSVSKEREDLQRKGIEVTEAQVLELNKAKLEIFFARGPQGELVEIIGIIQKKKI